MPPIVDSDQVFQAYRLTGVLSGDSAHVFMKKKSIIPSIWDFSVSLDMLTKY
jgi:hypothetical protein